METINRTVEKTNNVRGTRTLSKSAVYSIALFVATVSYLVTSVAIQIFSIFGVVSAVVALPVLGYLVYKVMSNSGK